MSDTLTAPDPMAGRIIPREDFDTLTDAQLREKYPKAFEFADNVEREWAEEKKKEDARKATFEQMLGGDVKRIRKNGQVYALRPTTLRLQLAFAATLDRYRERGEGMANVLQMQVEQAAALLQLESADGTRTPATEDDILDAFVAEELDALLKLSRGEDPYAPEDEKGANPPAL